VEDFSMRLVRAILFACLISVCLVHSASARVLRVDITSRTDINDGKPFGAAGPYEKIQGKVYFAVDPLNVHNRQIVDLDLAKRNVLREVEFIADLYLIKPKDMSKGNGAVLFEVSNRGGKGLLRIVNGGNQSSETGDGFLMRQGYTVAWIGWESDVEPRDGNLILKSALAHGSDGAIHGMTRSDFTTAEKRSDMPLGHILLGANGGDSYPVDAPGDFLNILTVRDTREGQRQVVSRAAWSFGHEVDGKLVADPHFIHLTTGFEPGRIYEVVYDVRSPVVAGLGLAAVRDFLSFLKYDPQAVAPVHRVYAVGISQTGRFLRHFLYQDFNADEKGRQVIDGMIAHVAGAGRGSFNHRFAQPSRDSQPMSSIFYPTDLFPFTDLPQTDPETGESAGLLDAATKSHTAPKIFYTNTSYEYWGRAAALIHTSVDGTKDAPIAGNTRIYFLAGLQHFSGAFPPQKSTPGNPDYTAQQRHNANPIRWFWRALITDMNEWVNNGTEPPASVYPKISEKTLVPLSSWVFPKIPGVNVPHEMNLAYHLDFGAQWDLGIITKEPPKVGKSFPGLVPQPDSDGNDLGGVRLPELQVPLATYTGWNLRDPGIGAPRERVSFLGSYIPFAKTAQERQKSGDPRPSVAERYKSREQYMSQYTEATKKLIQQRFILAEDLPAIQARGQQEWEDVAGH
jgi:hypothetical protein